jgi:hypothetical protein
VAQFWVQDEAGAWAVAPLDGEAFELTGVGVKPRGAGKAGLATGLVLRRQGPDGESWLLLAGPSCNVRVNGLPVALGARVLGDKDEVLVGGAGRLFFSTERLVRVEEFPGVEGGGSCPRCKQAISPQCPAVRCPQCGVWHHQSDELPCWTYSPRCALCDHPTELTAGFRWTPEGI